MDPQSPAEPTPTPAPATNPAPPAAAVPAPQPEAELPGVPPSWEGAFKIYKYSKAAVQFNLSTLLIIWAITVVSAIVLAMLLGLFGRLLGELIGIVAGAAAALTYLAGIRRQKLEAGDAMKSAAPLILKVILLDLLVGLVCAASFLLLVVPFFFVFPRLVLATYYLVDKKMGPMDAYKASWAATKGHIGKVYGIIGASLAMSLLAFTIIGIPFAIYFLFMYGAATAILYEYLNKQQPAAAAAPAAAPAPTTVPPTAPTPPATV